MSLAQSLAHAKYSVTVVSPSSQLAQVVQPGRRASPLCTTCDALLHRAIPPPSHNAPGLFLTPALGNEC